MAHATLAEALALRGRLADADAALGSARTLVGEDFEIQFHVSLAGSRLEQNAGRALGQLRTLTAEAARRGDWSLQLEARLAHGELEMRSGQEQAGRERLREVARQASEHGFERIARQATQLAAK